MGALDATSRGTDVLGGREAQCREHGGSALCSQRKGLVMEVKPSHKIFRLTTVVLLFLDLFLSQLTSWQRLKPENAYTPRCHVSIMISIIRMTSTVR